MVDECKSDTHMDGKVFSAVDCPWEVLPYGHRIQISDYEWKAVAYRPTTGLPNSIYANTYTAYAQFKILDKNTKEVLLSAGPQWNELNLVFEDASAVAGLATASALFLAALTF